jgi:uncharacterized protein YuzE
MRILLETRHGIGLLLTAMLRSKVARRRPSTKRRRSPDCGMNAGTDTLLIEFRNVPVAETRDFDENTLFDLDAEGNILSITIEHASTRTDAPAFSHKQIAA